MSWFLILFLALAGCAHDRSKTQEPTPDSRVEELRAKFSTNLNLYDKGWPSENDCDGTLWAGEACAAGISLDIHRAELSPGVWHRRPDRACYPNDEDGDGNPDSRSTFSNDMALGLFACLLERKDYNTLKRFAETTEKNSWVMGDPPEAVGEVILRPNQVGIMGRMLYLLSNGTDEQNYAKILPSYFEVKEDYERHITALSILIDTQIAEQQAAVGLTTLYSAKDLALSSISGLKNNAVDHLDFLIKEEPNNYFFHAIKGIYSGDMGPAISLLLSDDTPRPTYVRGKNADRLELAHWLLSADIILSRYKL